MSHCSGSCCSGCQDEICKEQKLHKLEARHVYCCSEGGPPALVEEEDKEETPSEFEDGDRIFVTTLHRTPKEVRATSTISQRLAEAFKRNADAAHPPAEHPAKAEGIPDHL